MTSFLKLDVVTRMFVETKKEYDKVNDEYKKTIKEKLTIHIEIGISRN